MSEKTISGNAVQRDLERVADELGRAPTQGEYDELGKFNDQVVYEVLGKDHWRDFWELSEYSTEELLSRYTRLQGKEDIDPKYIEVAAEVTDHPKTVANLANVMLGRRYDDEITGRTQGGVTGGAVYYVAEQLDLSVSSYQIARVLDSDPRTVLNNYRELVDDWKVPQVEDN